MNGRKNRYVSCWALREFPGFPGCCQSCHEDVGHGFPLVSGSNLDTDDYAVEVCCHVGRWLEAMPDGGKALVDHVVYPTPGHLVQLVAGPKNGERIWRMDRHEVRLPAPVEQPVLGGLIKVRAAAEPSWEIVTYRSVPGRPGFMFWVPPPTPDCPKAPQTQPQSQI